MKKTYLIPTLMVVEVQAAQMLAESLNMYPDKTVPGNGALVKGSSDWDIFGEYSDEE